MNVSDYLENAIEKLLEEDDKVKSQFYSQIKSAQLEKLHQDHHSIKRWVEQLTEIQCQVSEIIEFAQVVAVQFPESVYFEISRSDMGGKAYGLSDGNRFKVLTGSYIVPNVADNMFELVEKLRNDHAKNINAENLLVADIIFDNPGQAARFVTGKQVNGILAWVTPGGTTYKEWSESDSSKIAKSSDLAFKKPKSVSVLGQTIPVSSWRDLLVAVCETAYKNNPECCNESAQRHKNEQHAQSNIRIRYVRNQGFPCKAILRYLGRGKSKCEHSVAYMSKTTVLLWTRFGKSQNRILSRIIVIDIAAEEKRHVKPNHRNSGIGRQKSGR